MLIKDILKNTARETQTKLQHLVVRELDEDSKGHFLAYVDDQETSFDVDIQVSEYRILAHHCDCGAGNDFCIHQLAVLNTLISTTKQNTSNIPKIKRKRKLNRLEELVYNTDIETLREWLLEYFKKNKDTAVEFSMVFGQSPKAYSPEDIEKTITDLSKTVLQRKRLGIPGTTIKKLVDMLGIALYPVEEHIAYNLTKPIGQELFTAICVNLEKLQLKIRTNSTRLDSFIQQIIQRQSDRISQLQLTTDWKAVALPLWKRYQNFKRQLSGPELQLIETMYGVATPERRQILETSDSQFTE